MIRYKRLSYNERIKIEVLREEGYSYNKIAKILNRSPRTIWLEVKRGTIEKLNSDLTTKNVYYADVGERIKEENLRSKEHPLKVGNDIKYLRYLEHLVKDCNYSPYAALMFARNIGEFDNTICTTTFYNYVKKRIFLNLKYSDLPYHKKPSGSPRIAPRSAFNNRKGRNIRERPKNANLRRKKGHWEGDTIVSKKGDNACLLVLTDRYSRKEIIRKIPNRKAETVLKEFNNIFESFSAETFKTITFDNGVEFMRWPDIEKDKNGKKRVDIYFCNAYRACERGTNENTNRIIRRFIPKGTKISEYSETYIKQVEDWLNNYPRKIFNGHTANDIYYNSA